MMMMMTTNLTSDEREILVAIGSKVGGSREVYLKRKVVLLILYTTIDVRLIKTLFDGCISHTVQIIPRLLILNFTHTFTRTSFFCTLVLHIVLGDLGSISA